MQVALKRKGSLFVTDPMMVPGLEQNELMVAYGYSYYAGTPWTVGHCKGKVFYTRVKIIINEVGCKNDTVPKTVATRKHCKED